MKIWIKKNKQENTDLFMEITEISFLKRADLYYFALDNNFMEDREDSYTVKSNVFNLLNIWLQKIKDLKTNCTIYLPFDFSDQYIGCLRIEQIEDNKLIINYGITRNYQGYSFNPSEAMKFDITNEEYEITTDSVFVLKDILLNDLIKSNLGISLDSNS